MVIAPKSRGMPVAALGVVMWLIPYESFTVQTGETADALVRRLRPQVAAWHTGIYWTLYDVEGFFQGRVDEHGFSLVSVPRSWLAQRYRLAIYGRFQPVEVGTEIDIVITLPWLSWAFFALVWCPVGIFCLVLTLVIASGSPGTVEFLSIFFGIPAGSLVLLQCRVLVPGTPMP